MASTPRLFLLLLTLAAAPCLVVSGAEGSVIEDGCKYTDANHDYCVQALSASPKSKEAANLHALARVALSLTAKNASLTSGLIAQMHDKLEDGEEMEDCLTVCKEDYVDAVEQLDAAKEAFDKRKFADVVEWVKAAQEYVRFCQKQCQSAPDNEDVLTQRNKDVRTLCSITIALAGLLH